MRLFQKEREGTKIAFLSKKKTEHEPFEDRDLC